MLKDFKRNPKGNYYSQEVGNYEVTVERMNGFYRVSLWKLPSKEYVESQDFVGTDQISFFRAMTLGDQLVKQQKIKTH